MENHCWLVFRGESSFQGFSAGAGFRPSKLWETMTDLYMFCTFYSSISSSDRFPLKPARESQKDLKQQMGAWILTRGSRRIPLLSLFPFGASDRNPFIRTLTTHCSLSLSLSCFPGLSPTWRLPEGSECKETGLPNPFPRLAPRASLSADSVFRLLPPPLRLRMSTHSHWAPMSNS